MVTSCPITRSDAGIPMGTTFTYVKESASVSLEGVHSRRGGRKYCYCTGSINDNQLMCRTAVVVLGVEQSRCVVDDAAGEAYSIRAWLDFPDMHLRVLFRWVPYSAKGVVSRLDFCLCEAASSRKSRPVSRSILRRGRNVPLIECLNGWSRHHAYCFGRV